MKILVCVLSCHKNWNLWNEIKSKVSEDLIIFSRSPKNENWYDKKERVLYLNCRDEYECLPEKIICMIEQVLNNSHFSKYTHILKIDDYEARNLTEEKIKNLYNFDIIEKNNYIGQHLIHSAADNANEYHFGKVTPDSYWDNLHYKGKFVPWCNGGKSYILSRKSMYAINKIYNSSNIDILYEKEIYEDLMIAKCLFKYKFFPVELDYRIT
jgi:hypothetical protein